MKTIKTRDFGEVPVEGLLKVSFIKPIFGFEELSSYYLIPLKEPESFTLLQSTEDVQTSFFLTQPRLFVSDYVLDVNDEDVASLGAVDHTDILDFAILTIPSNIEEITMNILGPLLINTKKGVGIQTISNIPHYNTKCRLFLQTEKETK
ncbi:MAG: flagellar assembly protein FliW [Brevinema sp.]